MSRYRSIAVAALLSLAAPLSRADWLYDPVAATITDGNWVLKVQVDGTELSVVRPLSAVDGTSLDLRAPVADSTGAPYAVVYLGGFANRSSLVSVTLPDTLRTFGPKAFTDCPNLETVTPFLPDSVEKLNPWTFVRCRKLRGAPRLAHPGTVVVDILPEANGSQFYECKLITSADLSGVDDIGRFAFYMCHGLTNVVFSKTLARIRNNVFQDCRALAELVFPGPGPVVDANVFQGCPSGKIRAHILGGSQGWAKPKSGTTTLPTADELARYREQHPGASEPSYVWTVNGVKIWLIEPAASDILEIKGAPGYIGVVSPSYGRGSYAPGTPVECHAPVSALQGGNYYASVGSVYQEKLGDDSWSAPVTNASRSLTVEKKAGTVQRLTWLWERRGRIEIPEAAKQYVTLSPASTLGNEEYPVGTEVTLSVTPPAGHRFWRWRGDVPEAQAHETTVTARAETLLSIEPLFSSDWTYDGTVKPKTMTDGNWTLAVVEREDGTLEVDKVLAVTTPKALDLSAPIHDAEGADRVLAAIDDYAFKEFAAIEYLRLPETLVSIGREAFWNCNGLKRIEPFLPESVSYIGGWAFALCSQCESPCGSRIRRSSSTNGRRTDAAAISTR